MCTRVNLAAVGVMAAIITASAVSAVIYVDDSAVGNNDGTSWGDAFTKLEDALAAAGPGEKVHVARGIYKPGSPDGSRESHFVLKDGIVVRGGFAGVGGGDPDERDVERYETILSGDLAGNDTVLTAENAFDNPTREDNCYHVLTARDLTGTVVLEGLIVTGAYSDHTTLAAGGALSTSSVDHILNGLVQVVQCRFAGNAADDGGAINAGTDLHIAQSIFTNNFAAGSGGALSFAYNDVSMENSIFTGNAAAVGGGAVDGFNHRLDLRHCVFAANNGGSFGGAIASNHFCDLNLSGCILWQNSAEEGSQIWAGEGVRGAVSYCDVDGLDEDGIVCWEEEFSSGPGNIDADPLFAGAGGGDYHLKSQAGRWDAAQKAWMQDDVTSPCIDAGDPVSAIMYEPFPNGGVVNMGAYGGTAQASKSWFEGPACERIIVGDLNGDCVVNLGDVALVAAHWLEDGR